MWNIGYNPKAGGEQLSRVEAEIGAEGVLERSWDHAMPSLGGRHLEQETTQWTSKAERTCFVIAILPHELPARAGIVITLESKTTLGDLPEMIGVGRTLRGRIVRIVRHQGEPVCVNSGFPDES